ncbi:MAG: type I 3-dehydroquinate dehydratase [Pseudomonadota bacterium]
MICVAVSESTMTEMLASVGRAREMADLVELRIDGLTGLRLDSLIEAAKPKPVIVTNRSAKEGGSFKGTERERVDSLLQALSLGADYVDLEWRTAASLREKLLSNRRKTKVIFSYHHFQHTPSRRHLLAKFRSIRESGADIAKIVTMAVSPADNLTVLSLLEDARRESFPLVAFCMGAPGKISRVATLALGGHITYAALEGGRETAPGQISAGTLQRVIKEIGIL